MPDLWTMTKELGLDNEDYLLDGAVPSLYPHSDITHTRALFKRENADGTVVLSEEVAPEMLMTYASRSLVWIGSIANQLLELFPNSVVQHDAEQAAARLTELVERLRAQFGPR